RGRRRAYEDASRAHLRTGTLRGSRPSADRLRRELRQRAHFGQDNISQEDHLALGSADERGMSRAGSRYGLLIDSKTQGRFGGRSRDRTRGLLGVSEAL